MLNLNSKIYESLREFRNENKFINKKFFIYVTESITNYSPFQNFIDELSIGNDVRICVKNFRSEPSTEAVNEIRDRYDDNYDYIVGIGGGSVLDISKFLSFLFLSKEGLENFDFNGTGKIQDSIPLILIPTTSGSGSEFTKYCVVTNSLTRRKFTVSDDRLIPRFVIHQREFLEDLPETVRVSSTIDAYVHCYEAFVNHDLGHISKVLCMDAIRSLSKGIVDYNIKEVSKIAFGSMVAGILINENRTGLIHTASVALSEYTDLAHGLLNSILFEHVHRLNFKSNSQKVEDFQTLERRAVGFDLIDRVIEIGTNTKVIFHTKPDIEKIMFRISQDKGLNALKFGAIDEIEVRKFLENICYG